MRAPETIDSEPRLVAALRRAARERGGPLPSIDVADALLDERRELTALGDQIALVRVSPLDRAAPALLGGGRSLRWRAFPSLSGFLRLGVGTVGVVVHVRMLAI